MLVVIFVFLALYAVQSNCMCQCISYYGHGSSHIHGCDDLETQALCFRAEKVFEKANANLTFSWLASSNGTETSTLEKLESLLHHSIPKHDCFGALRTETKWPDTDDWYQSLCQSHTLMDECYNMKAAAKTWNDTVLQLSESFFSQEQHLQLHRLLEEQDPLLIDCTPVQLPPTKSSANQLYLSFSLIALIAYVAIFSL